MSEVKKIIRFKPETSETDIKKTEEKIKNIGGKITGKTTITGKTLMFTLPAGTITTFDADQHIDGVEDDGVVTIQ